MVLVFPLFEIALLDPENAKIHIIEYYAAGLNMKCYTSDLQFKLTSWGVLYNILGTGFHTLSKIILS